jgi:hypothetical protein
MADGSVVACINVRASNFDQSCHKDADCIEVSTGQLCSGGCQCPNDVIGVSGLGAYDMAIAPLGPHPACFCPPPGTPYCSSGACSLCPPGALCASVGGDGG